jgi:hypothetical protein
VGFEFWRGQEVLLFSRMVLGCTQPAIQWVLGFLPGDKVAMAHLRLVLRLRMSSAIHLFSLYAFMAWTETTLPLTLSHRRVSKKKKKVNFTV